VEKALVRARRGEREFVEEEHRLTSNRRSVPGARVLC